MQKSNSLLDVALIRTSPLGSSQSLFPDFAEFLDERCRVKIKIPGERITVKHQKINIIPLSRVAFLIVVGYLVNA